VGIGPKTPDQIDSADFVLGKFSKDQQDHTKELTRETNSILSEYAYAATQLPAETRNFIV
jgi:peptidyl-tRNA hydrolase